MSGSVVLWFISSVFKFEDVKPLFRVGLMFSIPMIHLQLMFVFLVFPLSDEFCRVFYVGLFQLHCKHWRFKSCCSRTSLQSWVCGDLYPSNSLCKRILPRKSQLRSRRSGIALTKPAINEWIDIFTYTLEDLEVQDQLEKQSPGIVDHKYLQLKQCVFSKFDYLFNGRLGRPTWMTIPVSRWLINMVSKSPK